MENNPPNSPSEKQHDSAASFDLSSADLVCRQQLNVLHYWAQKQSAQAEPDEPAVDAVPPGAELPDRWSLLKGLELREWQEACIEKWFNADRRGVVKVVTGAGKTVMACGILQQLQNTESPNLRVAIVVPTIVLLDQWHDILTNHSNLPTSAIGRLGGGYQDKFDGSVRILVCVLNSAASKLAKLASNLVDPLLLVVDECHRAGAAQMSKVFETKRAFSLGLSATPEREAEASEDGEAEAEAEDQDAEPAEQFDETPLGRELGPIIYELDYIDAIEAGILAKFRIQHYGLPLEPSERVRYERMSREITDLRRSLQSQVKRRGMDGGALVGWARRVASRGGSPLASQAAQYVALTGHRKSLVYHAKARALAVEKLVQDALDQADDTRILLFHESIAEVMRVFARLRSSGLPAVVEHSQLPDSLRAESLHLFRIGAARILVSAKSLIEGFDVPAADVGIVVASSSSVRQRIQTLGRILRKKGDENRAATLHVLYMAETTDEMIYEKQDWESVTGAARNQYFIWDPTTADSKPAEREGPPRRPKPKEDAIEWVHLNPGEDYPGAYEGDEFTSDSQGNVKDTTGNIASNPQGIPAKVFDARGNYGRFRVTPIKRAILVPAGDAGRILFQGFLPEDFEFNSETKGKSSFKPIELLVRSKAGGYRIARKIPDGEAFARTGDQASDPRRAAEAERLSARVKELENETGATIRKLKLLESSEVVAEVNGKTVVLLKLESGLEFVDRNLP